MTDTIKVVRGDNRPYVTLTFTKSDGTALDLSAGNASVAIKFRSVDSETTSSTLAAVKVNGGSTGTVTFNFPGTELDVPAGWYEGEVQITFGSERQTIYERLKFLVREKFA
jgi:hypothetical protein